MRALVIGLMFSAGLYAAPAYSQTIYCNGDFSTICEGCTNNTAYMDVTAYTSWRPESFKAHGGWCRRGWSGGGEYISTRIVQKPKLGEIKIEGLGVYYRSAKAGNDTFVVERTFPKGNKPVTAVITYIVRVYDRPL